LELSCIHRPAALLATCGEDLFGTDEQGIDKVKRSNVLASSLLFMRSTFNGAYMHDTWGSKRYLD